MPAEPDPLSARLRRCDGSSSALCGCSWEWLGRVEYDDVLGRQRARRDAIVGRSGTEVLWMLEHDPVITLGRRGGDAVARPGSPPIVATERGGLATYHGPGQLVGYLLLDAGRRGIGARRTVSAVEQGVIHWLGRVGVAGELRSRHPGVWVGADKICAIGLHFRRGVSMHGFALNLTVDLSGFAGFTPCGIADGGVTSVLAVRGTAPAPATVAAEVAADVLTALAAVADARTIDTPAPGR